MIWLFDVDGTLTPARKEIDPNFKSFFLNWIEDKRVYLVTGSDYPKTLEQVGEEILFNVNGVYASMGNSYWEKGSNVYDIQWDYPQALLDRLKTLVESSPYPVKAGNHIELRQGMINFSTIGRDCNQHQREAYFAWDTISRERENIQKQLLSKFNDIDVQIGGQISIDIIPRGKDKSQISARFDQPAIFFGDHIHSGGNDMSLALALLEKQNGSIAVHVDEWRDTYLKLKNLFVQ